MRIIVVVLTVTLAACAEPREEGDGCEPGAVSCADGDMRVCDGEGSWRTGSCGEGSACVPGGCADPALCPDSCRELLCVPGEILCAVDNVYVYECDASGTKLLPCGSCAAPPFRGACLEGRCVPLCSALDKSYIGCEYFAADLDNVQAGWAGDELGNVQYTDAENAQYAVVVSNPDKLRSVLVSVMTGPSLSTPPGEECAPPLPDPSLVDQALVPPEGLHTFRLPPRNIQGTSLAERAYRVASNVPITVYQFNPLDDAGQWTNDASLLLPTTSIGQDYFVMSRRQTFEIGRGFLTVIGSVDGPTAVTVTVTAPTLPGDGIPAMGPGDTFTTTLEQFDTLNIETDAAGADLTGSRVQADRPVTVYGGSECANAPNTASCDLTTNTCAYDGVTDCSCPADEPRCFPDDKCRRFVTCCCDHLEMQMFPISAWGSEYVAARSYPRGLERDLWRILASEDGTVVTLTPPVASVPVLDAGEWYELESADDFLLRASKPVLLGQFIAAQFAPGPGTQPGDAGTGDPSFLLAIPTRQLRRDYVFLAPDSYAADYVTIAAPANASVLLDDVAPETLPLAIVAAIGDTGWRATRVPVSDGYHSLSCSEPCGVIVYGYDHHVSYAYPGGLDLEDAP